jgi:hypothetical protein
MPSSDTGTMFVAFLDSRTVRNNFFFIYYPISTIEAQQRKRNEDALQEVFLRVGGVAQVVQCLFSKPSKHEALSSSPVSPPQKKKIFS